MTVTRLISNLKNKGELSKVIAEARKKLVGEGFEKVTKVDVKKIIRNLSESRKDETDKRYKIIEEFLTQMRP